MDGWREIDEIGGIDTDDNGGEGGKGVPTPVDSGDLVDAVETRTDSDEVATGTRGLEGDKIEGSRPITPESGDRIPALALKRGRAEEDALVVGTGRIAPPTGGKFCGFGKAEVREREETVQKSVHPMAGDLTAIGTTSAETRVDERERD